MKKTERLQMIVLALKQKGRQSASELAEFLEVSKRTIYRDIDAISQMNIPISSLEGLYGGYEINDDYFMPSVRLSEREVLILLMLLKVSDQLNLPDFKESIRSLALKLQNTYESSARQNEEILGHLTFDIQYIFPEFNLAGAFETILEAFRRHVKLRIRYYSPLKNKKQDRIITPFHLIYSEGGWYLDAYCHLINEKRTFRLDRILCISLDSEPIDATLEKQYQNKILSDPLQQVELQIDRNLYHLIQYDTPMKDARIISEGPSSLTVEVLTNRLVFFETLAIRNADQVTIVKPEALVESLRLKFESAFKKYQKR